MTSEGASIATVTLSGVNQTRSPCNQLFMRCGSNQKLTSARRVWAGIVPDRAVAVLRPAADFPFVSAAEISPSDSPLKSVGGLLPWDLAGGSKC